MNQKKRWLLETGFFIFYFIVLQLATEVQYKSLFADYRLGERVIYHLLVTPLFALPYFFYYKRQLPLIFEKKYFRFGLSVVLFIIFLEFYLALLDWYILHNSLLPADIRKAAEGAKNEAPFPRQMFSLTFTYLLTLTGFGYFLKKLEDERKLRQLKEQHLQLELHYLKTQLHPHFFFNTLNNIYSLALDNSQETAPTVAKLAELMRYILYDGNQPKVPLEKELTFLRHYIDLEKIRHNRDNKIDFRVNGKTNGVVIEPLLFVSLLENGFKHGINNLYENGWLKACLDLNPKMLHFEVENAVNTGIASETGGVGLANLRKRLQLLYPGRHSFETSKDAHAFKAVLKLYWT